MKVYQCKSQKLAGSDFHEVNLKAKEVYYQISKKTKRKPYVRSAYFNKEKIFLSLFWQHLFEKQNWRDRVRRLKYFQCGLELIEHSKQKPATEENINKSGELLHRFAGITKNQELFFVQIKENKRNGQKFLISIFPDEQ